MKVAVLFDNLGPYHLARLRAASRSLEICAVEVHGKSAEYSWAPSTAKETFHRATLFPQPTPESEDPGNIRRRLNDALSSFRPAALALPGWSSRAAFAALQWSLGHAVPVIVMADSTAHDEPRRAWKEWVKRRYLGLCSAALAAGRLHADYLVQLGFPRLHIFSGYDVVDNDHFAPPPTGPDTAARSFLASARFVAKKNLFRLLDAYASYRAQVRDGSPWRLVLLGDGPQREALLAHAKSLGVEEHVEMPGFIQYPELPRHFHRASVFIHASTTEQWGLVVNEAMASGLPVLVSDRCGCAPDLVEEGVNGWTFDPTNASQLAALMRKVAAPEFPLRQFGAASRQRIAGWGLDRFAGGLRDAAECARAAGPKRASLLDRSLLALLLRR